jgi:predicted transcriptional regulator
MCKKVTLGVLGLVVIGGLLFGSKVIPYAQTAYQKVKNSAQDSVPVTFQIDAAKAQLAKIGPEIKNMVHQIAKEKVEIKRLAADLKAHDQMLEKSYNEMMTLREHVQSGEQVYVATNNKAYSTARVEEDLRHRFALYQTAEKTKEKKAEILAIRQTSLETAMQKLDEAKAQQRELEVQIENLVARNRMNDVIATASQINIDNSQLAKTREMLDDIDALISAKEEVLNIAPKYYGQIPVGEESIEMDTNILDEMDAYFDSKRAEDSEDAEANEDDLVFSP